MTKLNEVKNYLQSNANMYVAWSYAECPADYPIYKTKAECIKARSVFFNEDCCFKNYDKKQLEKMYVVRPWVFSGKCGLEENVPVCTVDKYYESLTKC